MIIAISGVGSRCQVFDLPGVTHENVKEYVQLALKIVREGLAKELLSINESLSDHHYYHIDLQDRPCLLKYQDELYLGFESSFSEPAWLKIGDPDTNKYAYDHILSEEARQIVSDHYSFIER